MFACLFFIYYLRTFSLFLFYPKFRLNLLLLLLLRVGGRTGGEVWSVGGEFAMDGKFDGVFVIVVPMDDGEFVESLVGLLEVGETVGKLGD